MKNRMLTCLVCVALTNLWLANSSAQTTTTENTRVLSAAKVEIIERAINAWMAQTKAPALSIAIVADNRMQWSNEYTGNTPIHNLIVELKKVTS